MGFCNANSNHRKNSYEEIKLFNSSKDSLGGLNEQIKSLNSSSSNSNDFNFQKNTKKNIQSYHKSEKKCNKKEFYSCIETVFFQKDGNPMKKRFSNFHYYNLQPTPNKNPCEKIEFGINKHKEYFNLEINKDLNKIKFFKNQTKDEFFSDPYKYEFIKKIQMSKNSDKGQGYSCKNNIINKSSKFDISNNNKKNHFNENYEENVIKKLDISTNCSERYFLHKNNEISYFYKPVILNLSNKKRLSKNIFQNQKISHYYTPKINKCSMIENKHYLQKQSNIKFNDFFFNFKKFENEKKNLKERYDDQKTQGSLSKYLALHKMKISTNRELKNIYNKIEREKINYKSIPVELKLNNKNLLKTHEEAKNKIYINKKMNICKENPQYLYFNSEISNISSEKSTNYLYKSRKKIYTISPKSNLFFEEYFLQDKCAEIKFLNYESKNKITNIKKEQYLGSEKKEKEILNDEKIFTKYKQDEKQQLIKDGELLLFLWNSFNAFKHHE